LICEVIFDAIAKPAASSFALLILKPVDSLSIEVDMARSLDCSAFFARMDDMFVLIPDILFS
jgi:hypothetical protein